MRLTQFPVPRASTGSLWDWGKGSRKGGGVRERVRGCPREAAAGEVPGQLGSHLCPPRRPPQSSFLQEAAHQVNPCSAGHVTPRLSPGP